MAVKFTEELFEGLGFCISEKPDLLSQWRGYADDGQGFSIGFTKEYLKELANTKEDGGENFYMAKVLYEPDEHEAALKPVYDEIKKLIDSGALKRPINSILGMVCGEEKMKELCDAHQQSFKTLWLKAAEMFPKVHLLKNKAFSEEAEWRLVSYLPRKGVNSVLFRAAGDRLIPYREFKLKPLSNKSIVEVYIGPKNITPNFVVEQFLAQSGFPEVLVKRSSASYR